MEHTKENDNDATILEIRRIIREFQDKFKERTSQAERFLTINELENLWSELRGNTDVLYSDMIRQLMSTIDEKELIRKKKESTPAKE